MAGLLGTLDTDEDWLGLAMAQLPARGGGNALPTAGPQLRGGHATLAQPWSERIPGGLLAGAQTVAEMVPTTQQQLAVYGGASIPRDATYLGHDDGGRPIMRTADGATVLAPAAGNMETLATIFPTGGGGLLGTAPAGALGAGQVRRAGRVSPDRQTRALAPPPTREEELLSADANGFAQVSRDADARLAALTPEQRAAREAEAAEMDRLMRERTPPPLPTLGGRGATVPRDYDFTPGWETRSLEMGDTTLEYTRRPDLRHVMIDRLDTYDLARGQGSARRAMQTFLDETDRAGIPTRVIPEAKDAATDQTRLVGFYRSLGYRPVRGTPEMMQRPAPARSLLDEPPAAPAAPAAPAVLGNMDYGAEVLRQRAAQMDIPKPANRIQPDPAFSAFDATPTPDMLPGVPQGNMAPMRRAADDATLPLGDRARPLIEHRDEIADQMARDLQPMLGHDTQYFYHMRPVYEALRQDGMSHEDALRFIQRTVAPTIAGTSPRTPTVQNIQNSSLLQYRNAQGMPWTGEALRNEGGVRGYGMIYDTHPRMVRGLLDETHDQGRNPKPYYFGGNIGGDLAYTTADTHAIRAANGTLNNLRPGILRPTQLVNDADYADEVASAAKEGRPLPAEPPRQRYARDPSQLDWATDIHDSLATAAVRGQKYQPEYPIYHDIYEGVAQRLGIPTADAQSLAWFNYGPQTGLMSPPRTIPQLLDERISVTSQALGISPQRVLSLYRRGQIPLMGLGGAAVAPGLLEEPTQ